MGFNKRHFIFRPTMHAHGRLSRNDGLTRSGTWQDALYLYPYGNSGLYT